MLLLRRRRRAPTRAQSRRRRPATSTRLVQSRRPRDRSHRVWEHRLDPTTPTTSMPTMPTTAVLLAAPVAAATVTTRPTESAVRPHARAHARTLFQHNRSAGDSARAYECKERRQRAAERVASEEDLDVARLAELQTRCAPRIRARAINTALADDPALARARARALDNRWPPRSDGRRAARDERRRRRSPARRQHWHAMHAAPAARACAPCARAPAGTLRPRAASAATRSPFACRSSRSRSSPCRATQRTRLVCAKPAINAG